MSLLPFNALTFASISDYIPISRSVEGAFHERHETRSGMRWPSARQTSAREAQVQDASHPAAAGRSVEESPPGDGGADL